MTEKAKPAKIKKEAPKHTIEVDMSKIEIPELGNRGLKPYVFARFTEVFNKTKDLAKLPTQEEMTAEIAEKFPTSKFNVSPKIHYSYYTSKFFSFLREEREKQLLAKGHK